MNTRILVLVTLSIIGIAGLVGGATAAVAQPATAAAKQMIHPRALISQVEIAEYRRAIHAASTLEAKRAIREATYARLRQRAASRGMIMSEPQMWFGGLHWGEVGSLEGLAATSHSGKSVTLGGSRMAPRVP